MTSREYATFVGAVPDGAAVYGDERAGFAITQDRELVCLHNYTDIAGLGKLMVYAALWLGANHLNCFDGYLVQYYRQFGFAEYWREPFDRSLAPADWRYDDHGTPDVVFMRCYCR